MGVVLNQDQAYVWERGNRPTSAQIDPASLPEAFRNASVARLNADGKQNVVIVGYDQFNNTLLYDPATQQTTPMGQQDSINAFAAQGNIFMSYM